MVIVGTVNMRMKSSPPILEFAIIVHPAGNEVAVESVSLPNDNNNMMYSVESFL